MGIRKKIAIIVLILSCTVNALGQGLAITVLMRQIRSELDMRYVHGRFYWKLQLPPLFRSAKTGIIPAEREKINFAPPFRQIIQEK